MNPISRLQERKGIWRWRAKLPTDLACATGRREVSRSLHTDSFRLARRRVVLAEAGWLRTVATIREGVRAGMTSEEIEALVRDFVRGELDDRAALAKVAGTDPALADRLEVEDAVRGVLLDDVVKEVAGNGGADAPWEATSTATARFRARRGITAPAGSTLHDELMRRLGLAVIEVSDRITKDDTSTGREPLPAPALSAASTPAASTKTLQQALDGFVTSLRRSGAGEKWISEQEKACRWSVEWFGADRAAGSITVLEAAEFRDGLLDLASGWQGKFKGATIRQAVVLSQRSPALPKYEVQALAAKTFGPIRRMFAWAAANGYAAADPFEKVSIQISKSARRQGKRKRRDGFSVDQLQQVFDAPAFTGCKSARQWTEPGTLRIDDTRYWVPLLALYTGARRGELVNLTAGDVFRRGDIWCISIDERFDDDGNQVATVKTEDSIRVIPVHPELVRLGFIEFAQKGGGNLFDPNGDKFGKWFARLLDSVGLKNRRLVFHSFRHSFENAMLEGIDDFVMRSKITGREVGHSSAWYLDPLKAKTMHEKLSRVRFEGLDLSRLYPENWKGQPVAPEAKSHRTASGKRRLVPGKLRTTSAGR